MSKHLLRDLEMLKKEILTMGAMVEESMNRALQSLMERRFDLAKEVKGESVVGRAAWELYGRASEAGFGRLDTCGLLGLLEPRATP